MKNHQCNHCGCTNVYWLAYESEDGIYEDVQPPADATGNVCSTCRVSCVLLNIRRDDVVVEPACGHRECVQSFWDGVDHRHKTMNVRHGQIDGEPPCDEGCPGWFFNGETDLMERCDACSEQRFGFRCDEEARQHVERLALWAAGLLGQKAAQAEPCDFQK